MKYLFCLFMLWPVLASAQSSFDHKDWERGEAYYRIGEYFNAVKSFQRVTGSKYYSARAYARIGDCYTSLRENKKALYNYEIAVKKGLNSDTLMHSYATILKRLERYSEAKSVFLKYSQFKKTKFRFSEEASACDSAIKWKGQPSTVLVENLAGINTSFSEISPVEFDKSLVFSSNREGTIIKDKSNESGLPFYNLYKSERNKYGQFDGAQIFSARINSGYHDFAPAFTENFDTVYFTRDFSGSDDSTTRLKLYCSEKNGNGWSRAYQFILNDSSFSYACPFIDREEKYFFFSSDMAGGYGGSDLYVCLKVDSLWTDPINLGPEINTAGNEVYPYFLSDILFFSSDGHIGMGGFDNFRIRYLNGKWKDLKNLGYPANSGADDFSLSISSDPSIGYFASGREGGQGDKDIYKIIFLKPLAGK